MSALATRRGTIAVELEGRGFVALRPNDHVATGGEGSIYRISDLAVKIYLDPAKMQQRGIPDQITKMAKVLHHRFIVAPLGLARDNKGNPVGHYLPFVEDPPVAHPLSRVFSNDFYKSEGFNAQLASKLVDRMRETVQFAHAVGALLIDPNELNWFAQSVAKEPEPRIIDVDGWVLGQLPSTVAVMPSIRDYHAKQLSTLSDWFAWAVVTFQLYTGIHPYKGTLDGYGRADMETRMRNSASVFTAGVRLNAAVRDFSCIPGPLLSWYEATFQRNERCIPPSPFDTGITTPRAATVLRTVTTAGSGTLVFEKLLGFAGDPIIKTFSCGVALTHSLKLIQISTKREIFTVPTSDCEVVSIQQGWLIGKISRGFVNLTCVGHDRQSEMLAFTLEARRLFSFQDRLFAVTNNGLTELKTHAFGLKTLVSAGNSWGIMPNSTKWFQGVGVMDALGAVFAILPYGEAAVAQVHIPELEGKQVVTAKAGNRFASFVVFTKAGEYRKIELTLSKDYRTYTFWSDTTDGPELNLSILPKGVAATIVTDGLLAIWVPTSATGDITKIQDRQIATDMTLGNIGNTVSYIQSGELWSVRMK